ncbi:hypothetical protein TNIN_462321 [Trichonephila inaurata madagascariensis]|uniref:C2H2-type domain-containing protein n=1 Tax=Trichonephila inaurata madagascariensis TaxID=2747483 RepID=A0A8X7CQP5_9ARAC|nr:hypothetical protein TNIN_462321 [Trichonephila inaurata madagascariensis]
METQEFNTSRIHNFSQQQIPSHGEPSNSHFNCIYSNEENWELQQKRDQKDSNSISVVGRCIRTACDVLHGMDYENNDILSGSIDSQHNDIFPSEFNVFHSKKETSSCKDVLSDKNQADTINTSESKCEKVALSNKPLEHNSSVEIYKSALSQSQVEISRFERTFVCDICLKKLNTLSSLLTHNSIHSAEKPFQHFIHQENIFGIGYFAQQKRKDTKSRPFQCTICDNVFL